MTKPRKKPTARYHAFLVEPMPGFEPKNWQQNPKHYRILEFVGPMQFKGSADTWKFLHNHDAMNSRSATQPNSISTWALYLDFEESIFGCQPPTSAAQNKLASTNNATTSSSNRIAESLNQRITVTVPGSTFKHSRLPIALSDNAPVQRAKRELSLVPKSNTTKQ